MIPRPEIAWFAALCDDDARQLGVSAPELHSSWPHCREIVLRAEKGGFDNVLLPSSYTPGIDSVAFAGGVAPLLERMRLLVAVRCAELWPPMLARQLATLDQMLGGRLTVNIISSDLAGAPLASGPRYRRSVEVMQILRKLLDGKPLAHRGEFYQLEIEPPRIRTVSGRCPLFYFGGFSEDAREAAAREADVFLMWPDRMEVVKETLADMQRRAAAHGRRLRFGYRVHTIVRESESEARAAARHLVAALDDQVGASIRRRSLDHASAGVRRQAEVRGAADAEGYVEDHLWTGVGRARSGCGAALVGDPDQLRAKLRAYMDLGIEAFILSGYPHAEACDDFARLVLPDLPHGPLSAAPPSPQD